MIGVAAPAKTMPVLEISTVAFVDVYIGFPLDDFQNLIQGWILVKNSKQESSRPYSLKLSTTL